MIIRKAEFKGYITKTKKGFIAAKTGEGYKETNTDGGKVKSVRVVKPGTMPPMPTALAGGTVDRHSKSERPRKHKAGFAEHYLAPVVKDGRLEHSRRNK